MACDVSSPRGDVEPFGAASRANVEIQFASHVLPRSPENDCSSRKLFVDKPLSFEPGSKYRYSNAGFMVLGGVVQRVSGEDYFDYVRAHVYAPAGMKDTDAFELDHDPPNLAIGYTADRDAPDQPLVPGKLRNNLYMHVVKGGPAGGGFSTVGDLIAFGDAFLHGKLLSSAQVATLTTTHGAPEPQSYGCGFAIHTVEGQREVGHSGGFPGINSELAMFPDTGLSIATMANLTTSMLPSVGTASCSPGGGLSPTRLSPAKMTWRSGCRSTARPAVASALRGTRIRRPRWQPRSQSPSSPATSAARRQRTSFTSRGASST